MKKREVKKLQLSRETLLVLTSSDGQKVVGGGESPYSTQTEGACGCPTLAGC